MSIKHRDLAKAAIYTGFYLESLVQSSLPKEAFDKTYDLVIDNLNVMGVTVDLNELRQLDSAPKDKALGIARNTKSKVLTAITKSCGPQIGDWFELIFTVSILETGREVPPEFRQHLIELAARVGYPKSEFLVIVDGLGSPNHREFLKKCIEKSLEIVASPYIFISHATSDHELAEEFASLFESKNIKAFVANIDILPGTDWYEQLREEISRSDELLLIMSPESMKSDWVMIEVGAAWALGKPITPAVIYGDLESAPEPIKRFQAKKIATFAARQDLVEAISKRIYSD